MTEQQLEMFKEWLESQKKYYASSYYTGVYSEDNYAESRGAENAIKDVIEYLNDLLSGEDL